MRIEISEEDARSLAEYATIPIAFEVTEILTPESLARDRDGGSLTTRRVAQPWLKNYDVDPDNAPLSWAARFDLSGWGFVAAYAGGTRIGGAAIIAGSRDVEQLEDRDDLAVLWDLRVAPEHRQHGVGSRLLAATEKWARARQCNVLKVETQNINVPACRA